MDNYTLLDLLIVRLASKKSTQSCLSREIWEVTQNHLCINEVNHILETSKCASVIYT